MKENDAKYLGGDLQNRDRSDKQQGGKSQHTIPEVFYPAAEAEKLLAMILPALGEAQQLVAENPGKSIIFEWFLRSFQLCYQENGSTRL
jgi:hypothetical protein